MKKLLTITPIVIACLLCAPNQVSANPSAVVTLSEDLSKDATLIDVRSATEFKTGHLKNAINISHTTISEEIAKYVKRKTRRSFSIVERVAVLRLR